jgi:hypothetical protein
MPGYAIEPRKRNAAPGVVKRYFVIEPVSGETHDGPFRTKAEAESSAETFRDRYGSEPRIVTEEINPLATNSCDPTLKGDQFW